MSSKLELANLKPFLCQIVSRAIRSPNLVRVRAETLRTSALGADATLRCAGHLQATNCKNCNNPQAANAN